MLRRQTKLEELRSASALTGDGVPLAICRSRVILFSATLILSISLYRCVAGSDGSQPSGSVDSPVSDTSIVAQRLEPLHILARMDANFDGILSTQEIPQAARSFASDVCNEFGIDDQAPISLDRIQDAITEGVKTGELPQWTSHTDSTRNLERQKMRIHDTNFDGVIDIHEFASVPDEEDLSMRQLVQSVAIMRHLDVNTNGRLERDEVPPGLDPFFDRIASRLKIAGIRDAWRIESVIQKVRHVVRAEKSVGVSRAPRPDVQQLARNLVSLYDDNDDGVLSRSEWSTLSPAWRLEDRNENGKLSVAEIANRFERFRTNEKPIPGRSIAPKRRGQATPNELPLWFRAKDADGDGQVQMVEFASEWNDDLSAEFRRLDRDNDGIITKRECINSN